MGGIMFHSFRRVAILLGILLGAAMAQSTPVTNSYDLSVTDQTTVNSCSVGEPVALNGTVHLSYSVTTDTSGANHFAITATNNLSGVGQKTGAAYAASDSEDYTSNTTDASADLTVELKSDLTAQGGAPGLTLVQSLHIVADTTGNISGQVVSNMTGCGS
jgi:hypothetical protein